MVTVTWKLADGAEGESVLDGDVPWSFGRGADTTVRHDHPALSRVAISIRDTGPGPVLFNGQRDNGVRVALISLLGSVRWVAPSTAANLSDEENRVELHLGDDHLLTADITFDSASRAVVRH